MKKFYTTLLALLAVVTMSAESNETAKLDIKEHINAMHAPNANTDIICTSKVAQHIMSQIAESDSNVDNLSSATNITPTKTENINVSVQTAEWPSASVTNGCYFTLSERMKPNITWTIGINGLIGEFNEDNIDKSCTCRNNSRSGETLNFDNGTVVITANGSKKTVHVKAELVMEDAVKYKFEFDAPMSSVPEENYTYSNLEIDESYKEYGITWMRASDDVTQVVLTVNGDLSVPGTYTDDNATATFFRSLPGGETETIKAATILKAATTVNDFDEPSLSLSFIGEDAKQYNFNAVYTHPEPTEVLNLNLEGIQLKDIIEKSGIFQIYGFNEDETINISIVPTAKQIAGHYTIDDLKAYSSYNIITFIRPDGTLVEKKYYDADFDVTVDGDKATLVGTFLAGEYKINMNLKCNIVIAGLTYDTDEDVDVVFTKEHLAKIENYDATKAVYVILEDKDSKTDFYLYVYVDDFDATTSIPVGTYPVDKSYKAPSVQAGMFYGNNVYPTFLAKTDGQGNLTDNLWYAVNGTLTVTENNGELAFELNAKNSYKRNMRVRYNMPATAIRNVSAAKPAVKTLEGNKIIIRKNGKRYNAVGQQQGR